VERVNQLSEAVAPLPGACTILCTISCLINYPPPWSGQGADYVTGMSPLQD